MSPKSSCSRAAVLSVGLLLGCRQDMHDQPRLDTLEASTFFPDGMAARPPVAGTVARGQLASLEEKPALTPALVARGRNRYDVFCRPCHDGLGTGKGMVVQRGFKAPPSFHDERLRTSPDLHFIDVMTNGFGAMSSYAPQLSIEDRWAIVSYVRALQLSQGVPVAELPEDARRRLEEGAR